ncbi:hypothetical protein, partial [Enhygromyxa salina]|uniref:hypothetical protein n=1 Tax=Enhygromyxa salina TaxID=215803 RepID=UPI0011B1E2A4
MIPLSVLTLLCARPSPASAADCSAADTAALQACLAGLGPGDTLTLEPGEFPLDNLTLDGLAGQEGAPIVIRGTLSMAGERLSHVIGQSSGSNVIDIISSSYVELRDFELSFVGGTTGNGVDLIKFGGMGEASHHVVIDKLELHDTGNVAISSQAREIHDIVVTANHIHDIGGSCFYWGYYEDDNPLRWAHHSQIVANLLERCPADDASDTHYGIQLKSGNHDNLIADNVMVDVGGTTRAGIIVYHSAPKPVGSELAGSNRIVGNLLVRPRNEGINAAAGATIENNIVIDAGGIAIFLQPRSYGGSTYYGSLEVLHNTVVQTVGGADAHGIRWTAADWALDDGARPSSFVGNLALVSNGADGLRPPSAAATVDANATDANANGAPGTVMVDGAAVQSSIFGEPGYLVPSEGGALVDGVAMATVALDFAGFERDASPDIGAYEWTGVVPPPLDEDAFKPGEAAGDGDGDPGDGDGDGDPGDGDGDGDGDPGDGDGDADPTDTSADAGGEETAETGGPGADEGGG